MNLIERVPWDSDFFGFEVGKFTVDKIFDFASFENEAKKYRLVYIFSDCILEGENLKLVDKKVIFNQSIPLSIGLSNYNKIESFNSNLHDLDQLINLTLQSGIYSRFYTDENFKSNEYKKLYTEWILNCINGKLSFDILISVSNSKILGFCTISKKNNALADIGLVAVDKEARGKGLATELIYRAMQLAVNKSLKSIQVVTQLNNLPAVKLYTKTNFKVKKITNIYHYWNL